MCHTFGNNFNLYIHHCIEGKNDSLLIAATAVHLLMTFGGKCPAAYGRVNRGVQETQRGQGKIPLRGRAGSQMVLIQEMRCL